MAKNKLTRERNQSAEMNIDAVDIYENLIAQLYMSSLRWEGLPETAHERWMNVSILRNGFFVMYDDEDYGLMTLGATMSGYLNVYGDPLQYNIISANGSYNKTVSARDCVAFWDNWSRVPPLAMIRQYARRLADIDRTVDINVLSQKMPILISAPESQRMTIKNMVKQWAGNEPIIATTPDFQDNNKISYLTSGAPFVGKDLYDLKARIWAELMTWLGIDNTAVSKAERVQSAEVESNDEQIEKCALIRLDNLRRACDEANEKFGLNMAVYRNTDIEGHNMIVSNDMTADDGEDGGDV